jgi:hypothetical protein
LANDVTKTSEGSWYTTDYDGNKSRIVPNNTSTNSKSITVTWTQKYSGKTLQATFTQAAGRKVYSSWSYNCRVDKTSFSYSGGQSNVTAKSASRTYTWNGQGSSYTESETATVRVSSPASISGNSISIPSNSGSTRNFTVTFDFPTATDQTISISQEGGQVTYVDHLSISPTTKNVPGTGSGFRLTVNANYDKYINGTYVENIRTTYDVSETGKLSNIKLYSDPDHANPITGESGKIYLNITQDEPSYQFRWSGTQFVDSNTSSLILGEVTGTAYDGGKGKYLSNWRKSLVDNLRFYSHLKDNGVWTRNANEVRLNFDCSNFNDPVSVNSYNEPIPAATKDLAGVQTAADKKLFDSIPGTIIISGKGVVQNTDKI